MASETQSVADTPVSPPPLSKPKKSKQKNKKQTKATVPPITQEAYEEYRNKELAEKDIPMYPHKFKTNMTIREFVEKYYSEYEKNTIDKSVTVSVGGRIMSKRLYGNKLQFYDLVSNGFKVQILSNKKEYEADNFKNIGKVLNRGDIIGVNGYPSRSSTGELSIVPKEVTLLTPCFKMIPTVLKDENIRARQRYLDLVVNWKTSLPVILMRSKVIQLIRSFLNSRDFLEIQTPIVSTIAGGACARPFKTYHNDLKEEMFMRIAPELNLKRLIVGGIEKVYEIGPQFRNESIDKNHSPEFYSLEYYWAYADYYDMMEFTETLFRTIIKSVHGKLQIKFGKHMIDFSKKFKVIDMIPTLEEKLKTKFPEYLDTNDANDFLVKLCKDCNIDCPVPTTSRLLDKLVGKYIEPECVNPTFIINHPVAMSPLAKPHRDNKFLTERFELFIAEMELCNAFTELNDHKIQKKNFEAQIKDREKGDAEARPPDYDFVEALKLGLPPTGGFGLGIERLVMLITGSEIMRDIIPFPVCASEKVASKKTEDATYPPST
jgi:lysyl-tRNA synthetase class 2